MHWSQSQSQASETRPCMVHVMGRDSHAWAKVSKSSERVIYLSKLLFTITAHCRVGNWDSSIMLLLIFFFCYFSSITIILSVNCLYFGVVFFCFQSFILLVSCIPYAHNRLISNLFITEMLCALCYFFYYFYIPAASYIV